MNFRPNFETKEDVPKKDRVMKNYESVTKYMATDLITFSPDQSIQEVIDVILEKRISGAPVLNEKGELVGLISEKDCLKLIIDNAYYNQPLNQAKVEHYMTSEVHTVNIDKDIVDVANLFLKTNFRRFPVVDEHGKLKGQVSRRDILKATKDLPSTTW